MKRFLCACATVLAIAVVTGCSSDEPVSRFAAGAEEVASREPSDEQWVVSLGDSIISGEAGRWAGNQSLSTSAIDALGSSAYHDGPGGETIARCHRSQSAAIHIGDAPSMNLACSGALTVTTVDRAGDFKPGIDFFNEGQRKGQALLLEEFASEHSVRMVALSIGANDFGYAPIIEQCVKAYLAPAVFGQYCKDDNKVQEFIDSDAQDRVLSNTVSAILNIATAMENAGYQDGDWTLGVQLYPNLIADPGDMRYPEAGYDRQLKGGCGFRDDDVSWWASETVMPLLNANLRQAVASARDQRPTLDIVVMDAANAFAGHTLCSTEVDRVAGDQGVSDWQQSDAADRSEWAMEINIINPKDTYQQESMHPNYWGQLALRACWRQAFNNGDVRGGTCEQAGGGLNDRGEPNMVLR